MRPPGLEPPDYAGCIAGNVRAASRIVSRFYDEALRDHGLRITQVAILAQVRRLQPVTVTELAGAILGERSAVARDVYLLERAGLVSITVKAGDLRARDIVLTSSGAQRLRECAPAWRSAQAQVSGAFGADEVEQLLALVDRLVLAVGEL